MGNIDALQLLVEGRRVSKQHVDVDADVDEETGDRGGSGGPRFVQDLLTLRSIADDSQIGGGSGSPAPVTDLSSPAFPAVRVRLHALGSSRGYSFGDLLDNTIAALKRTLTPH